MNSMILGLLAETSIHPGAGQSSGFVDLPVAREAATDYPVIVGSSMKGALRDHARDEKLRDEKLSDADINRLFGKQEAGGALLISDARLLLLPVRSLKTQYKWVTCPHLIERLMRDLKRTPGGIKDDVLVGDVAAHQYLGFDDGELFLEERQFSRSGGLPDNLLNRIRPLVANAKAADRLASQLVVISDNDFVWFARYGLAINARNHLDEIKKTSKNLWYEETIPPDSLFYWLLAEREDGALKSALELFKSRAYLQAGGHETVGQGWFAVALPESEGAQP